MATISVLNTLVNRWMDPGVEIITSDCSSKKTSRTDVLTIRFELDMMNDDTGM